jgi:hypothetical protein
LGQPVFMPRTPAPPRRFTRQTWTMITLLVLLQVGLVVAIAYVMNTANRRAEEEIAAANRQVEEAMAEADRLDPHWQLGELEARRVVIPDKENSARVVESAKKLIPRNWPAWDYPAPDHNQGPADEDPHILQESFDKLEPPEQLNGRQISALRTELKRAGAALVEARKLAEFPNGRYSISFSPDFISTLMPHAQDARAVASFLAYDALLRIQDRDVEGALASCRSILNVGRSIGDEPMFISQMVRLACRAQALARIERALAQGLPGQKSLADMQKLLEREEKEPLFLIAARGERAGWDRLMKALEIAGPEKASQILKGFGGMAKDERGENVPRFSAADIISQRAAALRYLNRIVEAAKLPLSRQIAQLTRIERGLPNQPELVRLLAPATVKVAGICQRSQGQLRCAIAALAVEQFRLAHHGRRPDSLAALVPQYLDKVPTDPYDGAPLRFRPTGDGVVIYCLGPDGKDDGGRIDRVNPHGPGTDVGFRLWDVGRRRQPAKPVPRIPLRPPKGFPAGAVVPLPGGDR